MKEVKKENWKYLVVFFLMALSIGVGNYFNLRAEAGGWGIVGMAAVISTISMSACSLPILLHDYCLAAR